MGGRIYRITYGSGSGTTTTASAASPMADSVPR
jgi:hypothetical protein